MKKRDKIKCKNCGKVFYELACHHRKYCCVQCAIDDRPENHSPERIAKQKATLKERWEKGLIWQNRKKS